MNPRWNFIPFLRIYVLLALQEIYLQVKNVFLKSKTFLSNICGCYEYLLKFWSAYFLILQCNVCSVIFLVIYVLCIKHEV